MPYGTATTNVLHGDYQRNLSKLESWSLRMTTKTKKVDEYKPERKLGRCYSLIDKPRLIQRIEWHEEARPGREGVDRYFGFDYMGSTEFEWGTLPDALKFMREDVSKWGDVLPLELKVGKHVAWYIGPPDKRDDVEKFFAWQLDKKAKYQGHYLQERTQIDDSYEPENEQAKNWYGRIIGWWALDAHPCPWVFFKEKRFADRWLKCIKEKVDAA